MDSSFPEGEADAHTMLLLSNVLRTGAMRRAGGQFGFLPPETWARVLGCRAVRRGKGNPTAPHFWRCQIERFRLRILLHVRFRCGLPFGRPLERSYNEHISAAMI